MPSILGWRWYCGQAGWSAAPEARTFENELCTLLDYLTKSRELQVRPGAVDSGLASRLDPYGRALIRGV